jgi:hypothetical protein
MEYAAGIATNKSSGRRALVNRVATVNQIEGRSLNKRGDRHTMDEALRSANRRRWSDFAISQGATATLMPKQGRFTSP